MVDLQCCIGSKCIKLLVSQARNASVNSSPTLRGILAAGGSDLASATSSLTGLGELLSAQDPLLLAPHCLRSQSKPPWQGVLSSTLLYLGLVSPLLPASPDISCSSHRRPPAVTVDKGSLSPPRSPTLVWAVHLSGICPLPGPSCL